MKITLLGLDAVVWCYFRECWDSPHFYYLTYEPNLHLHLCALLSQRTISFEDQPFSGVISIITQHFPAIYGISCHCSRQIRHCSVLSFVLSPISTSNRCFFSILFSFLNHSVFIFSDSYCVFSSLPIDQQRWLHSSIRNILVLGKIFQHVCIIPEFVFYLIPVH